MRRNHLSRFGGFTNVFEYDNNIRAETLWYHDHALGITRLNVYAGLAAFYIVRDNLDNGRPDNELGLPTGDQELAYAIQDRLFSEDGSLFYPAFPGDPFYEDFIVGEGADLPEDLFPNGGPSALAEFFGDIMLVNGKIWPKADVDPREYRMHLLNGCDSRYLVLDFIMVDAGATSVEGGVPLQYTIIGSDGGLGTPDTRSSPFVLEPGARYDVVIDMAQARGSRVIMRNLASDTPFGGAFGDDVDPLDLFDDRRTDRVMAFDVSKGSRAKPKLNLSRFPGFDGYPADIVKRRDVALFEGLDEFGRLMPLLGAKTDGSDMSNGLFPAYTWSNPTTELPEAHQMEEWYIHNFSADAHPIHLHLVNFEIVGDFTFRYEVDGDQVTQLHNGSTGTAPKIKSISEFSLIERGSEYYDAAPKDTVVVNPGDPDNNIGRGAIIRTVFPKVGRFVWHCHLLSHEDHEMMRVFQVVPKNSGSSDDDELQTDDDDDGTHNEPTHNDDFYTDDDNYSGHDHLHSHYNHHYHDGYGNIDAYSGHDHSHSHQSHNYYGSSSCSCDCSCEHYDCRCRCSCNGITSTYTEMSGL